MATREQRENYRLKWSNTLRTEALLAGGRGRPTKEYFDHIESMAVDLLDYKMKVKELIKKLMEEDNG